jgi:hypothetical protein
MAPPRSTQCASCKRPHTDADAFYRAGEYADGSPRFRPYCKACAAERSARPETRERRRAYKERKRREAGVPKLGEKEYCANGHLRSENRRPGRSDCAACHREQERRRNYARGAKPRQLSSTFACGHAKEGNTRLVKGVPKGCKQCHRERERKRPFNPETWRRYADKNRERLNAYHRAWSAANRPKSAEFRRGGPAAMAYVRLISSDPCVYCGSRSSEIDHIIPVARGGTGIWTNLAPICRTCNASKSDDDVLWFLSRRLDRQPTS